MNKNRNVWAILGLYILMMSVVHAHGDGDDINYGHSGSWFNAETDGQGFNIDIIPSRSQVVVYWFTFGTTAEAGQRWYVASGSYTNNPKLAELVIFEATGGVLNNPTPVSTTEVGTMTLSFDSCSAGELNFNLTVEESSGEIQITKLVPDAICDSLHEGTAIVP